MCWVSLLVCTWWIPKRILQLLPVLAVRSNTPTSIALAWTQRGGAVDMYTVSYNYTIRECGPGLVQRSSRTISGAGTRDFVLTGLEEDSSYNITLTALEGNRRVTSNKISSSTRQNGKSNQISVTLDIALLLQSQVAFLDLSVSMVST